MNSTEESHTCTQWSPDCCVYIWNLPHIGNTSCKTHFLIFQDFTLILCFNFQSFPFGLLWKTAYWRSPSSLTWQWSCTQESRVSYMRTRMVKKKIMSSDSDERLLKLGQGTIDNQLLSHDFQNHPDASQWDLSLISVKKNWKMIFRTENRITESCQSLYRKVLEAQEQKDMRNTEKVRVWERDDSGSPVLSQGK